LKPLVIAGQGITMALTNADFGLLQQSIEAISERIAALHLSLVVERDFNRLRDFLRAAGGAFIYPTFDPDLNDLNRDSFWLRLIDVDGVTVASHAERVFETADFYDLIESGELWFGVNAQRRMPQRLRLMRPQTGIAGTVGHAGSLWVEPRHRGLGLSLYLPYLSRSLCLRNLGTDFHTGLVFKSLAGSRVPTAYYGYPHVQLIIRDHFPPTKRDEEVYICHISREESLAKLRALAGHAEFPVPLDGILKGQVLELPQLDTRPQHVDSPAIVRQRKNEPAIAVR
jgi:hypothetical protein